jgi:tryptophan-rich sensory protein
MAAWLVWRSTGWADGRVALTLFFVQLGLNILWSALFFGLRQPGLAMVEIVFFLTAIIATATAFLHFPRLAFGMMAPYVLWVSFASILNLRIWQLNR